MNSNINVTQTCTDIPGYLSTEEVGATALDDDHISTLLTCIVHVYPSIKAEVINEVQSYCSFRDNIAVMDGIANKGRFISALLQKSFLDQLYVKHMSIQKTRLLVFIFYRWNYIIKMFSKNRKYFIDKLLLTNMAASSGLRENVYPMIFLLKILFFIILLCCCIDWHKCGSH